ncbi:polysaccharide deacetylase family protein [Vibrio nigripulchritudo]|uniref:polysaccharide deacetylase family protein n=1 Tax=Vibrio nigripulchritudo TaxID=28173 RepID=UPI0003B1A23B|nr:polysaccharide deacetylase family protein [Vibrio nigripulchritudo]CCN70628.1 putative Polysaccharide deacetylase [Vibrio nigripulchritudo SFn118]
MNNFRTAYLTIDDGPSKFMLDKIEFLLKNRIPAVFFCCGSRIEKRFDVVVNAIKSGYIIGNHSYSHKPFSEISLDECVTEIRLTDEIIEEAYRVAGVTRVLRLFRFPFGDKGGLNGPDVYADYSIDGYRRKNYLQAYLKELGYTQIDMSLVTYPFLRDYNLTEDVDCYWTYDTLDWSIPSKNPIGGVHSLSSAFARMDLDEPLNRKGLNSGSSEEIVLIHDQPCTHEYFNPLVSYIMKEKRFNFKLPNIKTADLLQVDGTQD